MDRGRGKMVGSPGVVGIPAAFILLFLSALSRGTAGLALCTRGNTSRYVALRAYVMRLMKEL